MVTKLNIIEIGSANKPISIDISFKQNNKPKPLVIFVHGFKGFKDWGHFNLMASHFAEQDFVFAKFNFSHNGTTLENPTDFADLEAFGNNTYLYELQDLKTVIDSLLSSTELSNEIDQTNLYLIGHSRGGAISILMSAEDARIKKLATWASVSDIVNRQQQKTIDTWKKDGVVFTYNSRTKQNMPLYRVFYDTTIENKNKLDIKQALKRINIPYLVIHGTNDEAVNYKDAQTINANCNTSQLLMIDNANHTFDGKHPWLEESLPKDAKIIINATINFLNSK
jgi:uncharacterized protein